MRLLMCRWYVIVPRTVWKRRSRTVRVNHLSLAASRCGEWKGCSRKIRMRQGKRSATVLPPKSYFAAMRPSLPRSAYRRWSTFSVWRHWTVPSFAAQLTRFARTDTLHGGSGNDTVIKAVDLDSTSLMRDAGACSRLLKSWALRLSTDTTCSNTTVVVVILRRQVNAVTSYLLSA